MAASSSPENVEVSLKDIMIMCKSTFESLNSIQADVSRLNKRVFFEQEVFSPKIPAPSVEARFPQKSSSFLPASSSVFERSNFRNDHMRHHNEIRTETDMKFSLDNSSNQKRRLSFNDQAQAKSEPSWYEKRLKSITLQELPSDKSIGGVVRSIVPLDPAACQVSLSHLSLESFFTWSQQMVNLQIVHPFQEILWGQFIDPTIVHYLNAFNEDNNITGDTNIIIAGRYLKLSNDVLVHLITSAVLPKSEAEWRKDFLKLVKFPKMPTNCNVDITLMKDGLSGISLL